MQKTLFLIRGLPGAGKTTLAHELQLQFGGLTVEADMWMTGTDGLYRFDTARLPECHELCRLTVQRGMEDELSPLIVANTFIQLKYLEPYQDLAIKHGYRIVIMTVSPAARTDEELAAGNTHNVPVETIRDMRGRWEA